MTPWISACTDPSPSPVRLGVDRRGLGGRGGEDRDELAVLPLDEVEAARGCSGPQLRLPNTVGHSPWCREVMIVALSILPVLAATASRSCPQAKASALELSMAVSYTHLTLPTIL